MKNVIIIAYEFYPINSGGSHRPYRMAKYFKENNINPIIITAQDDVLQSKYDESLEYKNKGFEIYKTPLEKEGGYSKISKRYYVNIVDDIYLRWKRSLLLTVQEIILSRKVDAVLITCPPFSLTQVLADLKKSLDIPLLLDMRDAWSQWNVSPYATKIHYLLTLSKERKALTLADNVLVTSKVTLQDFIKNHPSVERNKFIYVPNSFDDFEIVPNKEKSSKESLNIGYVGSFYYNPFSDELLQSKWYKRKVYQWFQYVPEIEEWKYRSPFYFFQTLALVFNKRPDLRGKVKVNLVGELPLWLSNMIDEFKLSSIVTHHGRLAKDKVVEFQQEQDLLLLTSSKRDKGLDYSIAGKTFEYFSLKKTILAFVNEGAQKDILKESELAVLFTPDNLEKNATVLISMFDNNTELQPNVIKLAKYKTIEVLKPLLKLIEGA